MNKLIYLFLVLFFFNIKKPHAQQFEDASFLLGPNIEHTYNQIVDEMPLRVSGGVAVADINNDNYFDIVASLGDAQSLKLLIGSKAGDFLDETSKYHLDEINFRTSSPHFFNYNNDEFIDLIVGSVDGTPPVIFKNINGEEFEVIMLPEFEILRDLNTITISSVDFDKDGNQDLFLSHWLNEFGEGHFWKNLGTGNFQSVDYHLNFYSPHESLDFTFTANFIDIDKNGFDDLMLCSDFGTSQIWLNEEGQRFTQKTDVQLSDENGMGGTIADFDNDGDFDWFVTSIFDDDGILEGNWGGTGNKFYVNHDGEFIESAEQFGLANASWGWGTSFADFNNDGYSDIVVVNGWPQGSDQFKNDSSKLFISDNGLAFRDFSTTYNFIDTLQGRGVSCFDFNDDGLLDILISNYRGPVKLYMNKLEDDNNYIKLNISESSTNTFGHGVEVKIYHDDLVQTKKIGNSSNYVSQNPNQLHFGLGKSSIIDSLIVFWNDNSTAGFYNVDINQTLHINKPITHTFQEVSALVYPNPASQKLSIAIKNNFSTDTGFFIFDNLGREIMQVQNYAIYKDELYIDNIDISSLSSGKYSFVFSSREGKITTIPFIKN